MLYKNFRKLVRRESGSVAIYTALTLPLILGLLGFGLDYSVAISMKTRLDAAADTAALAGVKAATSYIKTHASEADGTKSSNARAAGVAAAKAAFQANATATLDTVTMQAGSPKIEISPAADKSAYTGVVSYRATRANSFGGLFGIEVLPLNGSATATQSVTTYVNIYILVDTSQSMGIAADEKQMAALYKATSKYNWDGEKNQGCVFGCHEPSPYASDSTISFEKVAHDNGIQLRIDVANQAIQNMVQYAQQHSAGANISFSIVSMQANPRDGSFVKAAYPNAGAGKIGLTNDYSKLLAALQSSSPPLHLGPNTFPGSTADTDQPKSLQVFADTYLSKSGNGATPQEPKNFVFIITDGTVFPPGSSTCTGDACRGLLPSWACDPLKNKNATVGTVYTTYPPIHYHNDPKERLWDVYAIRVDPIVGYIPGNMRSCATSDAWYFEAADGASLDNALTKSMINALSSLRLTQ